MATFNIDKFTEKAKQAIFDGQKKQQECIINKWDQEHSSEAMTKYT